MKENAELYTIEFAAATWVTSTHSNDGGNCVQTAHFADPDRAGVRDSKVVDSPVQVFGANAWGALTEVLKRG